MKLILFDGLTRLSTTVRALSEKKATSRNPTGASAAKGTHHLYIS